MTITDQQLSQARDEMHRLQETCAVVSVRYQRSTRRVVLELVTGIQLSVPVDRVQGLAGARAGQLSEIEMTFSGLGLHWPQLDADVYVPGLLKGALGSKKWMASLMEGTGEESKWDAKRTAARHKDRLGGRPCAIEESVDTRAERQANLSGSANARVSAVPVAPAAVARRSAAKGKTPS
ncbi:DUF2442 domain-containing protein [Stenotrophomonas sp.]|uniref:DUF2442 domain-containing protein n=1 Tax=Stenotrophomonas sp. TaxID=69392 RepID=UPI0028A1739D|nr:DUF2442 domain-containing protein [Stenotrophomonas sp.]